MNWQHIKTILWLRWRLSRNQFTRAGTFSSVATVLGVIILAGGAIGLSIGGVAGGIAAGRTASPELLLGIWDGLLIAFLFVWLIGFVSEVQRSESLDITKLLHLPITLRQVFLFNYIAAHATPTLVLFLPMMLAFCLGLAFGAGPRMLLLAVLVIAFVLMVTAWTYCLRGWLAGLMSNRRRRQAVVM
jgi:ABC-2 type transport system permease protein